MRMIQPCSELSVNVANKAVRIYVLERYRRYRSSTTGLIARSIVEVFLRQPFDAVVSRLSDLLVKIPKHTRISWAIDCLYLVVAVTSEEQKPDSPVTPPFRQTDYFNKETEIQNQEAAAASTEAKNWRSIAETDVLEWWTLQIPSSAVRYDTKSRLNVGSYFRVSISR